jgi:two-component system cell cycle sensor histidine kinase/response regulator CckA
MHRAPLFSAFDWVRIDLESPQFETIFPLYVCKMREVCDQKKGCTLRAIFCHGGCVFDPSVLEQSMRMKCFIIDDNPIDRELVISKLQREFGDAEFEVVERQTQLDSAINDETISQLRESEERYRELFEQGLTAVFACTPDGTLLTCNPAFAAIFGCSSVDEAMQTPLASFYENSEAYQSFLGLLHREKRLVSYETELYRKNGEHIFVVGNIVGTFDTQGNLVEIKGYLFDNTRRKQLEERYLQAQKMESLGQLVSGISHDFNTMLGGILGHSSRCLARVTENHPLYENLCHIHDIAERAARMTRQLLAFSRRQVLEPKDININAVVAELLDFIGKILADDIEIVFTPDPALRTVHADATQIEQVVMNLCINARDAMPCGGQLFISTRNVHIDRAYQSKHPEAQLGQFVLLSVRDTGTGMDEMVREHVFEPFFTTKEPGPGKGTGLGLSTVHGIVGQHNGFIEVESEVGSGTTFNVYLPVLATTAEQDIQAAQAMPETRQPITFDPAGDNTPGSGLRTKTILLVEDDPDLRYLMQVVLEESGYEVLSAANGEEGLEQYIQHEGSIALVVSDVITPRMRGKELYNHIHEIDPQLQFLFVSGYQANQISQNFVLDSGFKFLPKPFDLDELIAKVQEALE